MTKILTFISVSLLQITACFGDGWEDVRQIKAALESMKDRNNPCLVTYTSHVKETDAFHEMLGGGAAGREIRVNGEYGVKGRKFMSSSESLDVAKGSPIAAPSKCVFNGKQMTRTSGSLSQGDQKVIYEISSSLGSISAGPWEASGYDTAILILKTCLSEKDEWFPSISNNEDTEILELKTTKGWLHVIKLKNRNLVESVEIFCENGNPTVSYSDIHFREFEGVSFPVSSKHLDFDSEVPKKVIRQTDYTLTSYDSNPAESTFTLPIPSDAVVYDVDRTQFLRDPLAVEARLDEIASQGTWNGLRWTIVYLNLAFIVLATISWFVFFKKRGAK